MQDKLKIALEHYKADRLEAALAVLLELPPLVQASEPVLTLMAGIYVKLGRAADAGQAFLKLSKMPVSGRADYARMAVENLGSAGCVAELAENAAMLLEFVSDNVASRLKILKACEDAGRAGEVVHHIAGLDLSDPHQAMAGMRLLRAAGHGAAVIPFLDRVLAFHPDDGLFNAERFSQALKDCVFDVADECKAAILEGKTRRGANMHAAEALHRRLMWCNDPAMLLDPALEKHMLEQQLNGKTPLPRRAPSSEGSKLRIAYISNNFRVHANMTVMRQVLREHDETQFEIGLFCYTNEIGARDQASWPQALREKIISIRDLSDMEAVRKIAGWKADILVDLNGFTGGARPAIVALSDVPVKVAWFGYAGSTPWLGMDYCVVDHVLAPEQYEQFYVEKLCRLPECYFPTDPNKPLPAPPSRASQGLPEDAFVFSSFNTSVKVNREVVKLWARLLKEVPTSVFWCYDSGEPSRSNIVRAFQIEGIAAERVIFAPPMPYAEHINRAALADLAVDTFPCGGHTTTTDMLWAGVPVVNRIGETYAARVSASILTAIGLQNLVTHSAEEYVKLALELACDRERLAGLRRQIEENRFTAPLFDSERFTRHLEKGFEMMVARARTGLKADHINVPALPPRQGAFAHSA